MQTTMHAFTDDGCLGEVVIEGVRVPTSQLVYPSRWVSAWPPILPGQSPVNYFVSHVRPGAASR